MAFIVKIKNMVTLIGTLINENFVEVVVLFYFMD